MKVLFVLLFLSCWNPLAIEAARSLRPGRGLMHDGKEGKLNAKKKETSGRPVIRVVYE